jgi:FtsP/CotA-like multicopper oxidase with cupredoxin domain
MMKRLVVAHLFLLTLLLSAFSSAEELKASIAAKVYAGPEGERVTMVYLEPAETHRVLIKFENFEGSTWNGKIILHETTSSGDGWQRRQDFKSKEMQRPTIVVRGEGWRSMEVRPMGVNRDFTVDYEGAGKADDLIKEYQKSHK